MPPHQMKVYPLMQVVSFLNLKEPHKQRFTYNGTHGHFPLCVRVVPMAHVMASKERLIDILCNVGDSVYGTLVLYEKLG